ncbi:MAG: TIGR03943 family protein [Anaerolineaceae bacterium]|nr:TIGR03943 family protein [Anaerolineaceae bacterium]
MGLRTYRTFQALVLAALGLFLLQRVWSGSVLLYINQRFVLLVLFASIGFLVLSQTVLRERPLPGAADDDDPAQAQEEAGEEHEHDGHEHEHDHDHSGQDMRWGLWLVALPVILGLLVPVRSLGTSALANRGITTDSPLTVQNGSEVVSLGLTPEQRTILDWIRTFNYADDPDEFTGQGADVTGFVYHDPRLSAGRFMVGRFSITCCVADALALGMVVAWPDAGSLPDNQWVRVHGNIEVIEMSGEKLPMIQAEQIEYIDEPDQPYLYP